jgi:hypothetical protein
MPQPKLSIYQKMKMHDNKTIEACKLRTQCDEAWRLQRDCILKKYHKNFELQEDFKSFLTCTEQRLNAHKKLAELDGFADCAEEHDDAPAQFPNRETSSSDDDEDFMPQQMAQDPIYPPNPETESDDDEPIYQSGPKRAKTDPVQKAVVNLD